MFLCQWNAGSCRASRSWVCRGHILRTARNSFPHAKTCGSGYIARTTGTTAAEIGVGPFSMMGRSFTGASGNAITTRVGGGYTQISGNTVSGEKGNGVEEDSKHRSA